MKNVEIKVEKNKLLISVDLSKEHGTSGSGKSTIIGSTEGNVKVQDAKGNDISVGLNVYKKKESE